MHVYVCVCIYIYHQKFNATKLIKVKWPKKATTHK